jgi:hypothetical protein
MSKERTIKELDIFGVGKDEIEIFELDENGKMRYTTNKKDPDLWRRILAGPTGPSGYPPKQ